MNSLNAFFVSLYKALGFLVLSAILFALGAYLSLNLFYLGDRAWVVPAVIAPTDTRVLQVSAQVAQYSSERARLAAQRKELLARLEDMDRVVAAEQAFQRNFRATVQADLHARSQDLERLQKLGEAARGTQGEIERARRAYTVMSRQRLDDLLQARLIDSEQFISGTYHLAQIAHSNLSLAREQAAIQQQAAAMRREIDALRSLASPRPGTLAIMTYEMLRIQRDLERSLLEQARAEGSREALRQGIAALDQSLGEYDRLLATARNSPLLRATGGNLTVAYVPYANLDNATEGTPLFGCYLGILICRRVGRIVEHLPGEVSFQHPLRNQTLRGRMVQIELDEARWAEEQVLLGRKLLF
ncbi:MAG: hypothetical protein RMK29_08875 [Myxococcales bacterium]|nr:hypothetical protein [Myxococcota bacterium]MDW8281810.1 hypothetical protein [Myxococcales bacterium]